MKERKIQKQPKLVEKNYVLTEMIETVRRYFGSGLGSRRPRMVFPGYALKFLQLKWEEAVNMWQGKQELKMEP